MDQFSVEAFIFILILIVYVLTAHVIQIHQVSLLHESGVAILMGFLTAILVKYTMGGEIEFNNQIFFTIILPPIIFSAGYSLRKSLFFQNFGLITFLGVVGTIMAFILISLFCTLINNTVFNSVLETKQILLLSSVLCATDTVAAMSLIKPDKYPVLNAVLFGEGIVNDAVAIVLFRAVSKLNIDENSGITANNVLMMGLQFVVLLFFSLAIGAAFGFGLSYLLKINQSFNRYPIKETSLILLTGYLTYLIGELLGFSGIIALFTCAIIMGHYTFMNISEQSQRGTGLAFQTVSYIAEAFVYAYLGASVLEISGNWLAVGFAMMILIFFPFVRALMVYFLPVIYKCTKKNFPLDGKQLKIVWYSGMVRGVIAFALGLQIQTTNESFIQTITLIIVMITTILGASFLKIFAECIGLSSVPHPSTIQDRPSVALSRSLVEEDNYKPIDFGLESGEERGKEDSEGGRSVKEKFQNFENTYMKPLFKKDKNQAFNYEMEFQKMQPSKSQQNNKL